MSEAVICYPRSFLERPEDRRFLMELKLLNQPDDYARLCLYRLWADYATGGSDRRDITCTESDLEKDSAVLLLEDFCGWNAQSGDLIRAALAGGFLRLEEILGKHLLVCTGFFPMNSPWCRDGKSMQKKGGISRALQSQKVASAKEATERETLWQRRGDEFEGISQEQRRKALHFIMRLCRAVNISYPDDESLRTGPLRKAADTLVSTDPDTLEKTLLWLVSNRDQTDVPKRIDQLIRRWDGFVDRAKNEMG